MIKALFYKEWIKIRVYTLLALLFTIGYTLYHLMRILRVAELKGASHIWEVMLQKDVIFLDALQYIPLCIGIALALVQFVPEMYHKSLKLTLHLPHSPLKLTYTMLLVGFAILVVLFGINLLIIHIVLHPILAYELYAHVVNTLYIWFLAGLVGYFFAAWITLEPTWRVRLFNCVVSALVLRIYFISATPEAYNHFLPWLLLYTLCTASLAWISVKRFKAGKQ